MNISIDKEILSTLPIVEYNGKIHVVSGVAQVDKAVRYLMRMPMIGIDTETRPSFHKGERHLVALIQIATHNECFLFRVNKTGVPQSLAQLLTSDNVVKVGLSLHDDYNALRRRCPDIKQVNCIELQEYVTQFGISDMSLQKIYAILFDRRISKGQRVTNWEAGVLSEAQQQYAAIDAWACLKIYDYLSSGKFKPELSKYIVIEEELQQDEEV